MKQTLDPGGSVLQQAQALHSWGWCVVPIPHKSKHPEIPWLIYQTRMPDAKQIELWWKPVPDCLGPILPDPGLPDPNLPNLGPPRNYRCVGGECGDNTAEEMNQPMSQPQTRSWSHPQIPGIGAVCGSISANLVCLDFDDPEAYLQWYAANPKLAKILPTAGSQRGTHVFFRTPEPVKSGKFLVKSAPSSPPGERTCEPCEQRCGVNDKSCPTVTPPPAPSPGGGESNRRASSVTRPRNHPAGEDPRGRLPAGDLISEGKLVVLPPTIHPSGRERDWEIAPFDPLPTLTLEQAGVVRVGTIPVMNENAGMDPGAKIGYGLRHAELVQMSIRLRKAGFIDYRLEQMLQAFNKLQCDPPVSEMEVRGVATWADNLNYGEVKKMYIGVATREQGLPGDPEYRPAELSHHYGTPPNPEEAYAGAFKSIPEYLDGIDDEPIRWLVEGFLPQGYLVVLGGTSKAGKSCLLTAMAMAIASGKEFLGLKTAGLIPLAESSPIPPLREGQRVGGKDCPDCPLAGCPNCPSKETDPEWNKLLTPSTPNPSFKGGEHVTEVEGEQSETGGTVPPSVLWCCYEESVPERQIALREYEDRPANFYITHEKPMIDTEDGIALLRFWIEKTKAKLMVVDPLYGANAAESLTDGKSARNALQGLKDLCNETGCTAIVIHHFTKNVGAGLVRERLADSNQITATASMDVLMDSEDEPGGTRLIKLKCRGRGLFANQMWLVRSRGIAEYELVSHGEAAQGIEACQRDEAILAALDGEPLSSDSIAQKLGVAASTVRNNITRLVREGKVAIAERINRKAVYRLATVLF